jgi:hypothetical protein
MSLRTGNRFTYFYNQTKFYVILNNLLTTEQARLGVNLIKLFWSKITRSFKLEHFVNVKKIGSVQLTI